MIMTVVVGNRKQWLDPRSSSLVGQLPQPREGTYYWLAVGNASEPPPPICGGPIVQSPKQLLPQFDLLPTSQTLFKDYILRQLILYHLYSSHTPALAIARFYDNDRTGILHEKVLPTKLREEEEALYRTSCCWFTTMDDVLVKSRSKSTHYSCCPGLPLQ